MAEFHKYGTSGKFYFPLLLASTQNFASTGAITFSSSDVTIVKDGSTYRNLTNTPTGVAMGSAAVFQVVTSASEMQAEKIAIQIKDETGALVQDQMLIIDTYGSSVAAHEFDLNQSIENSTIGTATNLTTNNDKTGYALASTAQDDLADAVWDEPIAAHGTTNEFGGLVVDNLDANITSRLGTTVGAQLSSTAVDLVWDEVLNNASHNVAQSAGKRLRNITDVVVRSDTAQGSGSGNNQIQLDVGASTMNGAFDPASIHLIGGAGSGQSRGILEYDGATKIATVNRNWKSLPGADSEFVITPWVGHDHVNEGLAQGGTVNTITLNTLASTVNDVYVGQLVFIVSGVGDDQVGLVTGYVGATKVATVEVASTDSNWAVTPTTQSAYVMLPQHVHLNDEFAEAVWDAPIVNHATTSQFGGVVQNLSTDVKSEINDLIFVDTSSQSTGQPNTGSLGNKIAALNERMFNHHQQDSSTQVVMKTGSTSEVKFVMTVTNTTGLQTVQEASTA